LTVVFLFSTYLTASVVRLAVGSLSSAGFVLWEYPELLSNNIDSVLTINRITVFFMIDSPRRLSGIF
jgi:hypothetical protein